MTGKISRQQQKSVLKTLKKQTKAKIAAKNIKVMTQSGSDALGTLLKRICRDKPHSAAEIEQIAEKVAAAVISLSEKRKRKHLDRSVVTWLPADAGIKSLLS